MLLTYTFVQTRGTWWSTTLTRKRTQLAQSTYHCYLGALIEWYVSWKRVPSGPHLLLHKHKSGKNGEFWEAGLHWFTHRVRIFSDTPIHRYLAEAGSWWFVFSYCQIWAQEILWGGKYRRDALTTSKPSGLRHSCVVHNVVKNSMSIILFHILIGFWHMLTTKKLVLVLLITCDYPMLTTESRKISSKSLFHYKITAVLKLNSRSKSLFGRIMIIQYVNYHLTCHIYGKLTLSAITWNM